MDVMGKNKNNNKNGILAMHLNPADIVLMSTGKTQNGFPVVTEYREMTERWLQDIQRFSAEMDSKDEYDIPEAFLDYAKNDAELFAEVILDMYKPRYLIMPAYQEIEVIMALSDEDYSRFTFLLTRFEETLHDSLFCEAESRGIHILLVPFISALYSKEDNEAFDSDDDPIRKEMLILMLMRNESEAFIKANRNLSGTATVLDMEIYSENKKHNYQNSNLMIVHFHPEAFAYVKEIGKTTEYHIFLRSMYSSSDELSDKEMDQIDSYISDIFKEHQSADVLFIDPYIDMNEEEGEIPWDHLVEIVEYSVEVFVSEAISREMHVIILPYLDMNEILEPAIKPIKQLLPIKTVNRNEIYMEILSEYCKTFIEENKYLPGIVTVM